MTHGMHRRTSWGETLPFALVGALVIGTVACWPSDAPQRSNPPGRRTSVEALSIAAGGFTSCAVLGDGRGYCWGERHDEERLTMPRPVPEPFGDTLRWRKISLSEGGGCGVTTTGRTFCWGSNDYGQLGRAPDTLFHPQPEPVEGLPQLATVVADDRHACGLTAGGELWCWGANTFGQLGRGGREASLRAGPVAGSGRFAALADGGATCALGEEGRAFCWGANIGAVDPAREEGCDDASEAHDAPYHLLRCATTPTQLLGDLRFVAVSEGGQGQRACGLTAPGQLYCWGGRTDWRGDQVVTLTEPPRPVASPPFVAIASGRQHMCGLAADGQAMCWGENLYGQLGTGDTEYSATPRQVDAGLVFGTLTAGEDHTCGLARDGRVFCWGRNGRGQLGNGTTESSDVPVEVRFPP